MSASELKRVKELEAEVGFEPTNNGFANRRLRPLGYSALSRRGARGLRSPLPPVNRALFPSTGKRQLVLSEAQFSSKRPFDFLETHSQKLLCDRIQVRFLTLNVPCPLHMLHRLARL